MLRTSHRDALLAAAFLCSASLVSAEVFAAPPKIDPLVRQSLRTGTTGPVAAHLLTPAPGSAPVVIELDRNAGPKELDALRKAGVTLRSIDGRRLSWSRFVPARVDAATLGKLASLGMVKRVSPAPVRSPHPMDRSAELIGLDAARGARPALDLLTGRGTVVADLDTNADIYHPQFFRADAGYFDWIDADDNGVLDPGKDAIDLNRDGKADPTEIAQPIIAKTLMTFYGTEVDAREFTFDPSMDWLYLDENANERRDYSAKLGFDDTVPAFGEPLFVPDDVNGNGQIDVGERVARLGTSKFSKVYVHIEYYADVDHVFERGTDLSTLELEYTGGVMGYGDALHASGVLSIIAGDVPLPGRRWVGVAPEADLLLGFEIAQDSAGSLTWALGEKPDVMLHETAGWTGAPLDGSDSYSVMVDESIVTDSVTHTCPTGNTGGARKHVNLPIAAGATVTLPFDVPDMGAGALYYADLSLNFRGASAGGVVLKEPSGQTHDITDGPDYQTLSTGAVIYIARTLTDRDTDYIDVILYTPPAQTAIKPVPLGEWQFEITGDANTGATLDAYASDNASGWSLGVAWPEAIATDDRTIGIPAVSDHCIAVGAHTGHPASSAEPWYYMEEGAGELREYSGRGPRIDGVQKPDVAAPDNPWSAAPTGVGYPGGDEVPHGAMWPMGGTSGATPHVTGVAALLAQDSIRGDAARTAIRSGAISDALTGAVPNMLYGDGRLSAAGALGVPSGSKPPTLSLELKPAVVLPNQTSYIEPTAADPDGAAAALELKWDDGYDGEWDGEYGAVEARSVKHAEVGLYPYKARVRDAQGRIADAVVWLEVSNTLPQDAGTDADAEPDDAGVDGGTPSAPAAAPAGSDDGCGCRIVETADQRGLGVAALALTVLGLGAVRSRRRRKL